RPTTCSSMVSSSPSSLLSLPAQLLSPPCRVGRGMGRPIQRFYFNCRAHTRGKKVHPRFQHDKPLGGVEGHWLEARRRQTASDPSPTAVVSGGCAWWG